MASGAVLVQIDFLATPSPAHAPFTSATVGFCTGDTDRASLSIDGKGSTPTFQHGWLTGRVDAYNSGDASQGRGFFASVIDGEFSIADDGDGVYSPSWMIANGAMNPIGATVHIGYVSALGVVTRLAQLLISDYEVDSGVVRFKLKSPTYFNDSPMFGVRSVSALLTSETDPDNPTNPDTLIESQLSQFAGVGFGVDPIVKANAPIPVSKLCWWAETTLKGGGITGTSSEAARIVATTADVVSDPIPVFGEFSDIPSTLLIKCRSQDDAIDLAARIDEFRAAGYRIVVSDGRWFLDLDSYAPYDGKCSARVGGPTAVWNDVFDSGGKAYGMDGFYEPPLHPYFWINWNRSQYDQETPPGGVDAEGVSIFAVPKSVAVAAHQCIVNGLVSGNEIVKIPGVVEYENGVSNLSPLIASSDSFVAADFVKGLKLYYDNLFTLPADDPYKLGAIEDANKNGSPYLGISGGGSLESVITDPTVGWDGASVPAYFQGASSLASTVDTTLRVSARLSSLEAKADVYTVDSSWRAVVTAAAPIPGVFGAVGICDPNPGRSSAVSGAASYTLRNVAEREPTHPRWRSSAQSLEALRNEELPHPACVFNPESGTVYQTLRMDLYECFVWGYTSISFGSIYASIKPWWSPVRKDSLSTRGSQIICGAGAGTLSNGRLSWSPWTLPPYGTETKADAIASAMSSAKWVIIGNGDGNAPTFWWKTPGGSTWTAGRFSGAGVVRRIRFVPALGMGGTDRFIALFSNGTAKYSTDGASWTDTSLGLGFSLNDLAVTVDPDNGEVMHVIAGGTGAVYWTNDLATFESVGPGAGAGATYSVEYWDGYFYIGCAAGQVYRATPAQVKAGTWVNVPLGGVSPGDVVALAGGTECILASTWERKTFASADGLTWRLTLDATSMPPSNPVATIWGVDLAYMSGGLFVYADGSQIITSADQKHDQDGYIPQWTPEQTQTPESTLSRIRGDWLKGTGWNHNPIQFWRADSTGDQGAFSLGVDPPETGGAEEGVNATESVGKVCRERWIFAGEASSTRLDGSSDSIKIALPVVNLGAVQDSATLLNFQYAKVGSSYKGLAYTKNVDVEYVAGNDGFYFDGWGDAITGKAVWDACRAEYLKSGNLRPASLKFDTVPDAETIGKIWTAVDPDIGARISWIIERPRYVEVVVDGNESAAALAFCGCLYKINQTILSGRGCSISGTGYGVVVECDHDYIGGVHTLTVAFPPA